MTASSNFEVEGAVNPAKRDICKYWDKCKETASVLYEFTVPAASPFILFSNFYFVMCSQLLLTSLPAHTKPITPGDMWIRGAVCPTNERTTFAYWQPHSVRTYFTIVAGECVDLSNNKQLVICFLYIDGALAVHEDLIGLYTCDNTTKIRLDCQCLRRCDDKAWSQVGEQKSVLWWRQ